MYPAAGPRSIVPGWSLACVLSINLCVASLWFAGHKEAGHLARPGQKLARTMACFLIGMNSWKGGWHGGGAATIELRATKGRRSFCCHAADTLDPCMWQLLLVMPLPFQLQNAAAAAVAPDNEGPSEMKFKFLEQRKTSWMWVNHSLLKVGNTDSRR